MQSQCALFSRHATNNVAEYEGVLCSLKHFVDHPHEFVCFRVDSMLVAKQLNGEWACRNEQLQPLYEQCLSIIETLRKRVPPIHLVIEHIYREYNSGADSLANQGIDLYDARAHVDGVVINLDWF